VGLIIQAGPTNMHRRRMLDQALLLGITVEPGHGGEPPADGGAGSTPLLQITGEELYVPSSGVEEPEAPLLAPGQELAHIEGVGLSSATRVAGQEAGQGDLLGSGEARVVQG
jgi:hypothetical protein